MKKFEITNKLSRTVSKAGFQLRKHSPEILIVAGVVGSVTSAIMACKATLKIEEILENSKKKIDTIHETVEKAEVDETIDYSVEDSKKDLTIVYIQTGVELTKLYGPSIALGVLSIGGMVYSNRILSKRNAALAAAYTVVDQSFKSYRNNVIERFGKELDRELKYNLKTEKIEESVTDEKGKTKTVKKSVEVIDKINGTGSPYAFFFDETCISYTGNPDYDKSFLVTQQEWANQKLQAEGYLYLNDVLESLGIQKTKSGQVVGWIYDEKCPNGDNYVDFGIFDGHVEANRRFANGLERVVLLDFNVDGVIWDKM